MSTAILDPADAIAAAVTEVYDQLRDLIDRGPTDDPSLLDEIGALIKRARGRVTRARKRAEPPAERATEPATTGDGRPRPHDDAERPEPALAPTAPSGASPAAVTTPTSDRVTVRLAEPERATASPAPTAAASSPGRHRRAGRPWLLRALIGLLMVSCVAVAGVAGVPWLGIGAAAGLLVVARAAWRRGRGSHRRAPVEPKRGRR